MPFRLSALLFLLTFICRVQAADQPNVLVILTDDQGWGDLSVHGNANLHTPHIDSLARDGAEIDHFYVCPVCAPTRAEFLTGRYHPRTGVSGVSRGQERMNADETTLADLFHDAGYATGCFGKWHNGTQPPLHPNSRGFDEFYGFTSGHWGHYFSPPLDHNGERVRGKGYLPDDLTNRALAFLDEHRDQPFFCYVPLNTPHSPMMIGDQFYDRFEGITPTMRHRDPDREDLAMTRAALAMCENIDANVGRLLDRLNRLQLADDTIVVFFSDNGPNSFRWNGGMKGKKGSLDEGGVRSPFFIRWPGHIPAGHHVTGIAGAIDLLPTLTELAGIPAEVDKPLDGRSLVRELTAQADSPEDRVLYCMRNRQVSVRTQKYRLDPAGHLFDLERDPGQHDDIADQLPDIAAGLIAQAAQHAMEMKTWQDQYADRPFHVGYGVSTTLPARDGQPHGSIERSSKAPNNSFFKNWTTSDDFITWEIQVAEAGLYSATVHYTCAAGNEGAVLEIGADGHEGVRAAVTEIFDPPLYDKPFERVEKSHYFVKDFHPLTLGTVELPQGRCTLRLQAVAVPGDGVVDVHSIDLVKTDAPGTEPAN